MEKTPRTKGRSEQARNLLMLAFLGSAAGLTVALISLRMESSPLTLAIAVVGFVLSIASLQASLKWWKTADEAVREAHKTGWYWGSTSGLAVAGGLLGALFALEPTVSLRQFAVLPGDAGLVATGMLVTIVLAFIGYLIAWAIWWLRNR